MNVYPKTDIRHWRGKVVFQTPASRTYSVQLQHAGRRAYIGLKTANKEEAATLARKFYEALRANGWEAALAGLRGDPVEKKVNVTVGEYLDAVKAASLLHHKTFESYATALRTIASGIHHLNSSRRSTWRSQVDSIKLASLSKETIETWATGFVKAAQETRNPLKEQSAKTSVNSLIGRARSLFGTKVIARINDLVELPNPLPFAGVKVAKARVTRYRASFDFSALIQDAKTELATSEPEQFKVFLLAAMVGLRRNEIDKLPWSAFRFNEGILRIEMTEHYRPKTIGSAGDIPLGPEMISIFRGYHAKAAGEFVIESANEPDNGKPFEHYRCASTFTRLIGWLRSKGVISRTPLHTLRKEFGSQINAAYGLTAASEMLRHSDITITARHYIEGKRRPSLDHLLTKDERTIIAMDKAQAFTAS
jgi:integrase